MRTEPVKRILSLLPVLGQPRASKRISMLQEGGYDVTAAYFDRPYHRGRIPECPTVQLGSIPHGHYLSRLLKFVRALPKLRKLIKNTDLVYASGPDMAYMALFAGMGLRRPVILEVGDIREIQLKKGPSGRLIRRLDRFFVEHCALIVATAPDFVRVYYRSWLGTDLPALIIENKLEKKTADMEIRPARGQNRPSEETEVIRIGYFGLIRCTWSWSVLTQWAREDPDRRELFVAGYVMMPDDVPSLASAASNIHWLGPYRSPRDLPDLYGRVDLVWTCYPPIQEQDWNLKWARTNRFYESCFFKRPMIARHGSNDGSFVTQYDIGLAITAHLPGDAIAEMEAITQARLKAWSENLFRLPEEMSVHTNEAGMLDAKIREIANRTPKY